MTMISLNFIPPSYKDRLRMQRLYLSLKGLLVFSTIYLIGLAIILLAARYALQSNFTRIVSETTLVTRSNRDVERRIEAFNAEIKVAQRLEQAALPWAEFMIDFMKLVPNDVTLGSLDLKQEGRSSVSGFAKTRTDLLAFRDSLDTAAYLNDITLPVANLLERQNVNFTITFNSNVRGFIKQP